MATALVLLGTLLPVLAAGQEETPAVLTSVQAYGTGWTYDEARYPDFPLASEIASGGGAYTAWASAVPGRLRARSTCGSTPEPWDRSLAHATFVEHFHPARAGLPANGRGSFIYNFVLSGTLRISATEGDSYAAVAIGASSMHDPDPVGHLELGRVGSTVMLYGMGGEVAPGSYPEGNMFANPDGTRKVYLTVAAPSEGYYTATFRIPVQMVFSGFPFNQLPVERTWDNRIDFDLSAVAFRGAVSDFSATFEFAAQNPIVPDPADAGLPADGWTFTSASTEIDLPGPAQIAAATGSGIVTFVVSEGTIEGLAALDGSTLPPAGMPGECGHGFFSLAIAVPAPGDSTSLSIRLPAGAAIGTHWWYYDAGRAAWSCVGLDDDDGDDLLVLRLTDGGRADSTGADGTIRVIGGPSPAPVPQAAFLAAFSATVAAKTVEIAWRTSAAGTADFRLVARLGPYAWDVAFAPDGQGGFTAVDSSPLLARGGVVTYQVWCSGELIGSRSVQLGGVPAPSALWPAAPNPFNPRTRIAYSVYSSQRIKVRICDLAGRVVATLADAPHPSGEYSVEWNGTDHAGRAMPSGTYLVRMDGKSCVQSRTVTLVR